jgi:murein DD-endopeptidase MepM/ murein hydrolase activator NlpD
MSSLVQVFEHLRAAGRPTYIKTVHAALALSMVVSAVAVGTRPSQSDSAADGDAVAATLTTFPATIPASIPASGSGSMNFFELRAQERVQEAAAAKARAKAEARAAKIAKQRRAEQLRASRASRVVYPTRGHITARFGDRGRRWDNGWHTGVDFRVPVGTPVASIQQGQVVYANWAGAYGRKIVIRHINGVTSVYAHLSTINVRVGQTVQAGERIGRSGRSGNTTGPHLHLEVHKFDQPVNPLKYLHR